MKKGIVLILLSCILLSLCACSTPSVGEKQGNATKETEVLPITEPLPIIEELKIGQTYSVENYCTFVYKGAQLRKKLMPTYSNYSYEFGGSDYVLSFDFEYKNTSNQQITAANFNETFTFDNLSGMKSVVVETKDKKSFESSSYIIGSNETRTIHLITNVPENLQDAQLNIDFAGTKFSASFNSETNAVKAKKLSLNSKQVVKDHGEITLVDTRIESSIYPKNPGIYYQYYEASTGKTFVIAEFNVKNLDTVAIHPTSLLFGKIKADNYEFEGTCAVSVDDDSSVVATRMLEPLDTTTAFFFAEIPESLKNAKSITLEIRFYGQDYVISLS